jgi:two-component system cell cycle sensor histidine kinase/response regulator CckA
MTVNFIITGEKIKALQYDLLINNVSYILSKSQSGNETISALGMGDVAFYRDATKQGVFQDIEKHLTPGTAIAIFDTKLNEIVFTTGQSGLGRLMTASHIKLIASQQSAQHKQVLRLSSGETINAMVAFEPSPHWNWIIVSLVNEKQLFGYVFEAMSLSFGIAGLLLIFVFFIVYKLSNGVSKAIVALQQGAHRLSLNELDVAIDITGNNEFTRLASSFNIMAAEITNTQVKLRQAISQQKTANLALQESRKMYHDLVEDTPDLITRVDNKGCILFVNHAAAKIYGLTVAASIGRSAFDFVHSDDRALTEKAFARWLVSEHETFSFENRQVSVTGQVYQMIWSIRAEYDAQDNVCGFMSTARDITQYKRQEEERAKLESQLYQAQKMEAIGELAGGVAHDFNNMLGVILGHAEMALLKSTPLSPSSSHINNIIKASNHSADLTKQLLTFARKQPIEPKIIDLNDSVTAMLVMLQRLIGENIELTFVPEKSLWPVKVDASQMDQILANLCVNARDAISGIGEITIQAKNYNQIEETTLVGLPIGSVALSPGAYVKLSVRDNGSGMTPNVMEHVFEPFYTTKAVGEGTGLGLSTVFGAVTQNDGLIEVFSELKQGTQFNVYFPREIHAVIPAQKKTPKLDLSGTETVLIVEDDVMLLDIEIAMLEQQGYKVLSAETAQQAQTLTALHLGDIDLLLTDVVMPEMNGRELSVILSALCPEMKVLYMSGYTADIIADQGIIGDDIQFLQKPFSRQQLISKVRAVLDA